MDEQGEQLLAVRRQVGERLAQRGVALGGEQFLLGHHCIFVGDVADVYPKRGGLPAVCRVQGMGAFVAGGGGQPARQGGRVAEAVEVFHQA